MDDADKPAVLGGEVASLSERQRMAIAMVRTAVISSLLTIVFAAFYVGAGSESDRPLLMDP